MWSPGSGRQKWLRRRRTSEYDHDDYEVLVRRSGGAGGRAGGDTDQWMVHPSSAFRKSWDVLLAALITYCAIMYPLYIAFGVLESGWMQVLDRSIDCLFMLDVVLNFFTGIYDRGGVVMDQSVVASTYCRGWFAIDIVSSVPVDIIFSPRSMMEVSNNSMVRLHSLLRLMKITRLIRLQRIMQRLQLVLYLKNSALTIVKFILVWILFAHWFACGFIYLARLENYDEHVEFRELKEHMRGTILSQQAKSAQSSNIDDAGSEDGLEIPDLQAMRQYYVLALYHVIMIMLTIDMMYRPENSVERLFTVTFTGLGTGLLVYGSTVVVQIAMSWRGAELESQRRLDLVNDLVMNRQLRIGTGSDLSDCITYSSRRLISQEVKELIELMPQHLREKALMDLYDPLLSCGNLFPDADARIMGMLLCFLKPNYYARKDLLLHRQKPATAIYIIYSGTVYTGLEVDLKHIDPEAEETYWSGMGDVVGEAAFINLEGTPVLQPNNAVAIEFTDAHRLSRADMLRMADELPEPHASHWKAAVHQRAVIVKADQAIQGGDLVEAHSQQHHHAQEAGFAPQDDRYRRHPETERGIIQELRAELEAEKGKATSRATRVAELEVEVGWYQKRVAELERTIAAYG